MPPLNNKPLDESSFYEILQDKLYVSGEPSDVLHPFLDDSVCIIDCIHDIDLMQSLAPLFIRIPFNDEAINIYGSDKRLFNRLSDVAQIASSRITDGEKIIIHCTEGKNRSVFVAGLVILSLKKQGRLTVGPIVPFLRRKRPGCMNAERDNFAQVLNTLDAQ